MRWLLVPIVLCLLSSFAIAQDMAKASNAFGLDLYARLAAKPGNLVFSPASIATALTMTWGGARGETAAHMKKALHLDGAPAEVMAASGKLAAELQSPSRPVKLRIANRLFGERSYHFEPAYLRATETAYGAALESLDFKHETEKARAHMNAWIEDKTEKRIKDLLPANSVNGDTRLVLVNAIYFLGDWADPFKKESTSPGRFQTKRDAPAKEVPMMYKTAQLRVADAGDVRALELPYQGGQTSMLIVLPKAVDGLAGLEKQLDPKRLDAIVDKLSSTKVMIGVPKLELNPAESLSLGDELRALGMGIAFDRARADFTGMANPASADDRLSISKVFHKAFVKVDEKGTEAAAATAVVMTRAGSAAPQKTEEFIVDHPFLFFIRDNASGLILFMGRVVDPS